MKLFVRHVSHYRYDQPVRGIVQSHRLTPTVYDGQKTLSWQISVPGGISGGAFRDGAGDWVQAWSVPGPVQELEITVEGEVETTDLAGVLRGHRETVPPEAFMINTLSTHPDAALADLAASVASPEPLALAHALAAAVSDAIAYRPGVTHAHTTAAEAVAQGEGVCQDHAHAMIAVAHLKGLPARYVTGYLSAASDVAAHDASHAWAEVWIAGLGWVGFDPANRTCPDARYIRLGSGRDAREAAPIRGVARGAAHEALEVRVAIAEAAQQ
jgi:transglutaminase-like putative cysteine protease